MSRPTSLSDSDLILPGPEAPPQTRRVFGELRFHTNGDVVALAFSPQGHLWSVEEPGVLRQWNLSTGQPVQTAHLSDLETLWVFGPGARYVASASDDAALWEVATGKMVGAIPQPSWVSALALRTASPRLATGHDEGEIRIWSVQGGTAVREWAGHDGPISALAFSPDGRRLASAGEDRIIRVWDVDSGKLLGELGRHSDHIQALSWHPQGKLLVSAGWDRTARVWDTQTFQPIILLNGHADQVSGLAFSPDGKILACADSDLTIHLWDPVPGKELAALKEHRSEIRSLAFSPDGKLLATGGADRVIHLWDPYKGQPVFGNDRPVLEPTSLALSPDGRRLASTCGGAGVKVWDTATGQLVFQPENQPQIQTLAGSPDGRRLAAGGDDKRVLIWDAANGKQKRTMEGQSGAVAALAFSPDSQTLASASADDGTVWLWNLEAGEPAFLIPVPADGCSVETLAFHPTGKVLAVGGIDYLSTGGSDGAISLWDLTTRKPLAPFNRGTTFIAFHPNGKWLAAASLDDTILIWDVDRHRLAGELGGHTEPVNCLAYSADGRWLVSGGDDRAVRFWRADTGDTGPEHFLDTPVKAVCFSLDGRFLYTGNGNTTCYQFDVATLIGGTS